MQAQQIEERLLLHFPNARVKVRDLTGGGDHWEVTITAQEFQGKSLVEQHQLVYKALGAWMRKEIHALALKTEACD